MEFLFKHHNLSKISIMTALYKKIFLAVSFSIVCIATLSPAHLLNAHHVVHVSFAGLDKFIHFSIYLFLGMSIFLVFEKHPKLVEIFLFTALFSLSTEAFQMFIPGRHMDIFDGFANLLGLGCGGLLVLKRNDRMIEG
jgi:VanZ family protein